MSNSNTTRKIVLGLGNTLNCDEGLGVYVMKAIEARLADRVPDMELIDGGVLGLNPGVKTFPVSCRTGEGLDAWVNWLLENVKS